jgi:hypothetical protein
MRNALLDDYLTRLDDPGRKVTGTTRERVTRAYLIDPRDTAPAKGLAGEPRTIVTRNAAAAALNVTGQIDQAGHR